MRYMANIKKENEVKEIIETAKSSSSFDTIYLMSNGEFLQIVHKDYLDELKDMGYFVSMVFEGGNRVEA